jgi:hypothetical protein
MLCLQIPLAFMILLDPAFFKDTIFAGNDFSTLVMAISAGYFLYDTLEVGKWDLWCEHLSLLIKCTASHCAVGWGGAHDPCSNSTSASLGFSNTMNQAPVADRD